MAAHCYPTRPGFHDKFEAGGYCDRKPMPITSGREHSPFLWQFFGRAPGWEGGCWDACATPSRPLPGSLPHVAQHLAGLHVSSSRQEQFINPQSICQRHPVRDDIYSMEAKLAALTYVCKLGRVGSAMQIDYLTGTTSAVRLAVSQVAIVWIRLVYPCEFP